MQDGKKYHELKCLGGPRGAMADRVATTTGSVLGSGTDHKMRSGDWWWNTSS